MPGIVQPFGEGGFSFQSRMPGAQLGGRTMIRSVIGGGRADERAARQSDELHKRRLQLLDQLMAAQGSVGPGGPVGNPFQAGIDKIAASRRAEIGQGFDDALNTQMARLQDRGLGGSSFALTAAQGNEAREQQALSDLSGDIGALEIRGQEAAMSMADRQRQQQLQLLQSLLGSVF